MVHFIGIKGSGMASLACILNDMGESVKGSDIEKFIFTQKPLEERNIKITTFDADNIQEDDTVIIGNAFDESNPEVKKAMSLKHGRVYRYHEYLGKLVDQYTSVSIAGCHGKTTTTSMMAHLLGAVAPTGYLIGDGRGDMEKDAHYFVLESCEYKRHFMSFCPQKIILTSVESDHQDFFPTYQDIRQAFIDYICKLPPNGQVIYCCDDEGAVDTVNIAKKQLENAQLMMDELIVQAPCDGIIGQNYYENGEYIKKPSKIRDDKQFAKRNVIIKLHIYNLISLGNGFLQINKPC